MRFTIRKNIFIIFIISVFILSCQKSNYSDAELLLGTVVSIQLIEGGTQNLIQQSFRTIKSIEQMMSVSSDDYDSTVLLDINRQSQDALAQFYRRENMSKALSEKGVDYTDPRNIRDYVVPAELAEVLAVSIDIARMSNGAFDPTISPIVDVWGFNSEEAFVPDDSEIQLQLAKVHWQSMFLEGNVLRLGVGQSIDVGAIAKGYAADLVKTYLQDQGVRAAILDFGGNIVVFGEKQQGKSWNIGIQKPYAPGEYVLVLKIFNTTGMSIVTSGVYERYFEVDGKEYFHILDPRTGYPARNTLLSVTIVHSKSVVADALATAVFVMGLEEAHLFIEAQPEAEAIFITRDKTIVVSSGLKDNVELASKEYMMDE